MAMQKIKTEKKPERKHDLEYSTRLRKNGRMERSRGSQR